MFVQGLETTLQPAREDPDLRLPWLRVAVSGPSMLPALAPGEQLIVRRNAAPRPGAVVVVRRPERLVVKRVTRLTDDGRVWIEGDNSHASDDSRTFGAVAVADVVGEVRWRCWPPRAAGRVR